MSDDTRETSSVPARLGPIVSRLQEVHRKCLSLGARNEEAQDMAARLDGVITELSREPSDDEPPVPYSQLAGQLFPVARFFESLGFISVAKEIAHVEKSLTDLDPGGERSHPSGPETAVSADTPQPQLDDEGPSIITGDDATESESRRGGIPRPVGLTLLVVLIAVLVAIFLIRNQESSHEAREPAVPAATPASEIAPPVGDPQPVVDPTQATGLRETPTPGPRARLAALVGQSRLAYRRGDIDGAISLLSQATLIDNRANSVLETARTLVAGLVARADAAADDARWTTASQYLERARELAVRFELSTHPIDAAEHRHIRLIRYTKLDPADTAGIRAATGKRIMVIDLDGERFEGRIHDVVGSVLEIHEGMRVGQGGTLFHVDEIPLARISEIRVYPD